MINLFNFTNYLHDDLFYMSYCHCALTAFEFRFYFVRVHDNHESFGDGIDENLVKVINQLLLRFLLQTHQVPILVFVNKEVLTIFRV